MRVYTRSEEGVCRFLLVRHLAVHVVQEHSHEREDCAEADQHACRSVTVTVMVVVEMMPLMVLTCSLYRLLRIVQLP
jgi:hypothetical protein